STNTLTLNGSGTGNFNVATSAPVLNLSSSAVLGGTGTVTLSGASTWTGFGTMSGPGHTVLLSKASLALSDGSIKVLDGGRFIDNAGTVTMTGGLTLRVNSGGATFNNSGSVASLTFLDDATFQNNGATLVFNNSALVQKTGGTGTSSIGEFHNN